MFYQKTVLSNGITVISEKMESVRSASIGFWFAVGSRDETPQQAGMSHFMEHMMFKGTPTRTAAQISEEFDGIGAELNAFTSKEVTCYYARFVDQKIAKAVELFSDMLVNSEFSTDCITSEREVVIEEIARMEDTPDDYIHELFADTLFPQNTLGRPILGSREIVGAFTHEECAAYHDQHYTTGNLVVAVAGNINHEEVVALVEKYFAHMNVGTKKLTQPFSDIAPKKLHIVTKETEQAHIILGTRGIPVGDPARYSLSIMDNIFGGGMSSRLFQEVREKRGLAYAVFSYSQQFKGVGQYAAYVGTRPTNAREAVEVLLEQVNALADSGITAEELTRAKDATEGKILLSLESTSTRMSMLGRNEINDVEHIDIDEMRARYNAVQLADVAEVAKRILLQDRSLAIIGPYSESDFTDLLG